MKKRLLKVLILSDGRLGHLNRSKGVVLALRKSFEVEEEVLELFAPSFLPKALLPRLARFLPDKVFLQRFCGIDASKCGDFDVVVSAGGKTIGANAALAKLRGFANIYVGKTRGLAPAAFAITFPPYRVRGVEIENGIDFPPVNIDPKDLPEPNSKIESIGFLIGGATKSCMFTDADWAELLALLRGVSQLGLGKVVVATSPRTPEFLYADLEQLEGIELIDYRSAGAGSAQGVFACDAIFATADSTSMLTEAVVAKRPLIGLLPAKWAEHHDYATTLDQQQKNRLKLVNLPVEASAALEVFASLAPIGFNFQDKLGEVLAADLFA